MMKKRLMVLAFAGVLAVGLSSCGKKEVSSNHVQSVTSETGAETSISEGETPDLSEEQPEQVELPESEEVQGDISQIQRIHRLRNRNRKQLRTTVARNRHRVHR